MLALSFLQECSLKIITLLCCIKTAENYNKGKLKIKKYNMKNYIFVAAFTLLMMTACKDPQKDETVVRQRDSLLAVIDQRENSVNDFINSFNDVERNLDSVSRRQHIISMNSNKSDLKTDQKARINEEIKAINDLMVANSKKLKELNHKLNRVDKKNAQLQKTIETLNNQLTQKYQELAELNERLNALNVQVAQLQTTVDTLNVHNAAQMQIISDKTNELHTAYYVVGHARDLEKSKLIDKKGGLLGMGKTEKLSQNFDNTMFTKIDYTQTMSIPINSKEMKIVTTHPDGSYNVDKTGKMITSLMITDPEKFWSVSKYLVIAN
jgi:DNA repair exonuclease SbcCD ATPase subunit